MPLRGWGSVPGSGSVNLGRRGGGSIGPVKCESGLERGGGQGGGPLATKNRFWLSRHMISK